MSLALACTPRPGGGPTAGLVTQRGQQGGFTGAIVPSPGMLMFNLYTNPQEDDAIGIRHLPVGLALEAELLRYREVLKKFPTHKQIEFTQ